MGVAEAAGTEIIHYGPTEILPGVVINMQTMYMSWLTMLIVAAIVSPPRGADSPRDPEPR